MRTCYEGCNILFFALWGVRSMHRMWGEHSTKEISEVQIQSEEDLEAEVTNNMPMDNARMHDFLQRIDPELQGKLVSWAITFDKLQAQIIADENADRMRVIVPVVKVEDIEEGELYV